MSYELVILVRNSEEHLDVLESFTLDRQKSNALARDLESHGIHVTNPGYAGRSDDSEGFSITKAAGLLAVINEVEHLSQVEEAGI